MATLSVSQLWEQLWTQFERSIEETTHALGMKGLHWQELLVAMVGQLLVSAMILLLFVALYWMLANVLKLLLGRWRYGAKPFIAARMVLRYLLGLAFIVGLFAQYGAPENVLKGSARAGLMALSFYVVWLLLSRALTSNLSRHHIDSSLEQLCKNTLSVALIAMGSITVLAQFGFDVLSIIAGLGIVGIAVGFAAQSTLANFIAGITLLIERPFRIGDWVKIHGEEGRVVRIAFRTTWLRTRDNIFTMIPNESVATSDIVNFSVEGSTRIRIPLGIGYKESVAEVRALIMPILKAHPLVVCNQELKPRVQMREIGESALILSAQVWVQAKDVEIKGRISCELLESLQQALEDAGIELPYQNVQLHLDEAKALAPWLEPKETQEPDVKNNPKD
ncbi:mechanosensitive ion channel family protein [Oceanisphaera pacifica]|uniref:Small-conductance mechanosensitive channel n=1 Tax=Oceanisphaera pacifica TaxID=2818389 RepID=A0ABS3NGV5_9GAMM|nr:mechanosensitive ion channel family protein [Oceanisphaera pacifica]MBO1519510.1 mechanosensitive ion channel family protein [Oceanisphaera pacifica]